MYFVYVLHSEKDGNLYTGYTKDLELRFEQHAKGYVESTKNRRPLQLIYYEACTEQADALKREKYLKTHYGKMFLKRLCYMVFEEQTIVAQILFHWAGIKIAEFGTGWVALARALDQWNNPKGIVRRTFHRSGPKRLFKIKLII